VFFAIGSSEDTSKLENSEFYVNYNMHIVTVNTQTNILTE